jgi:ankyrin repeat protein
MALTSKNNANTAPISGSGPDSKKQNNNDNPQPLTIQPYKTMNLFQYSKSFAGTLIAFGIALYMGGMLTFPVLSYADAAEEDSEEVSNNSLALKRLSEAADAFKLDNYEKAISGATSVLAMSNVNVNIKATAYFCRGASYHKKGESSKAAADFSAMLALPDLSEDYKKMAKDMLARIQKESGKAATENDNVARATPERINEKDEHGLTLLLMASAAGKKTQEIGVIRRLLNIGADVNLAGPSGFTPLMVAVGDPGKRTDINVVKLLINAGADAKVQNERGATARDMAEKYGLSKEIIQVLRNAERNSVNQEVTVGKQIRGATPLMWAVVSGVPEFMENKKDLETEPPYKMKDVPELIERGANVNKAGVNGTTVLMYATGANNPALVRRLIAAGANVNTGDGYRRTALMYAVRETRNPNAEIVKILLSAGADADAKDKRGRTALTYAVGMGRSAEIIRILKEATKEETK